MKYTVSPGSARFTIDITVEQINTLIALSKIHYDGRCRAASKPREPGVPAGFLVRWKDWLEFGGANNGLTIAIFGELDTCLKIIEHPTEEHAAAASSLYMAFSRILIRANELYQQWGNEAGEV